MKANSWKNLSVQFFPRAIKGFTLIELIVSIYITSILASIAIPNFSSFIAKIRVNNEITQIQRLLATARNNAINTGMPTTLCPLNENNRCNSQWQGELSVFVDINDNEIYEPLAGEFIIRAKSAIHLNDKLQYGIGRRRVKFAPTGRTLGWGSNGTFKYCPKNHLKSARALSVATSGRFYSSTDWDHDGKNELRNGTEIHCRA